MQIKKSLLPLLFLLAGLGLTIDLSAQDDPSKRKSPLKTAEATTTDGVTITINYGAPSVRGRKVFGGLEEFGKVWRTGANEATTLEIDKDVTVNGEALSAGKYALFTIPRDDKDWTVIFNEEAEQWGAYNYKESKDALRVMATPKMMDENQEQMVFEIAQDGTVTLKWAKTAVPFTVKAQ